MNIIKKENEVLIAFGSTLNKTTKIFFSLQSLGGFLLILFMLFAFYNNLNSPNGTFGSGVFCLVLLILGCIFFWQPIKSISRKESLLITPDTFSIVNNVLFKNEKKVYEISKISDISYKGKTSEANNEGDLCLKYGDQPIYFGREVYSWDAEKINEVLFNITGGRLTIGNLPEDMTETISENNS